MSDFEEFIGFAVLVVAGILLFYAFQYWYVIAPIGIGLVAYFQYKNGDKYKEKSAQEKNQQLYEEALKRAPSEAVDEGERLIEFARETVLRIPDDARESIGENLGDALVECIFHLYEMEPFEAGVIPKPPLIADSMEGAKYRDQLAGAVKKFGDPVAQKVAQREIAKAFEKFSRNIPRLHAEGEEIATAPLEHLCDPREAIDSLIVSFQSDDLKEYDLFKKLRKTLNTNLELATENSPPKVRKKSKYKYVYPSDYEGEDVVDAYLVDTPFLDLFQAPLPFRVPKHIRYEHTAVVGGSGHGKTSLLQKMIVNDLVEAINGGGGFAVIDPKGSLCDSIAKLTCFAPKNSLSERLVIIDPKRDWDFPPCLNMFDLGIDDIGELSVVDRMTVKNNALDLIDYMFSDLLRVETTGRQEVAFKYVGDLMVSIPNANIMTLLDFLNDPTDFVEYIEKLEDTPRKYITKQFIDVRFDTTRKALAERIYAVLQLPMMEKMLDNKKNKVDLEEAIREGKIVLIKADENFFSTKGSSLFGGIWIALLFQAALSQINIPREKRRGFTIYIDEASMFFSDKLRQLLIKAREFKLGTVFAFQDLEQIESRQMRASVMGSTSTKLVGGLNAGDRRAFAQEINCDEEFLKSPKKNEQALTTEFACYIRGVTEKPMMLTFPLGVIDREYETMSDEEFQQVVANNRKRVSAVGDEIDDEFFEEEARSELKLRFDDVAETQEKEEVVDAEESGKPEGDKVEEKESQDPEQEKIQTKYNSPDYKE